MNMNIYCSDFCKFPQTVADCRRGLSPHRSRFDETRQFCRVLSAMRTEHFVERVNPRGPVTGQIVSSLSELHSRFVIGVQLA